MAWIFDSKTPIFKQIIDTVILRIIQGVYKPESKIDSVRELALEAGVNPNTIQRALTEIENTGLIVTVRGDGRYVTDNTALIEDFRHKYIKNNVLGFVDQMKTFGFSKSEIIDFISKEID